MSERATDQPPAEIALLSPAGRLLTVAEFHRLTEAPPEIERFATNLTDKQTRRAYETTV
jgi:hypothetical protein